MEVEDLHARGQLALVWCIRRYRLPTRATFITFADRRVRGEMSDEVRRWTHSRLRMDVPEEIPLSVLRDDRSAGSNGVRGGSDARWLAHACGLTAPDDPAARACGEDLWARAVRVLPRAWRRMFVMRYREDRTAREIRRRLHLDVAEVTVNKWLRSAREMVREAMIREGVGR